MPAQCGAKCRAHTDIHTTVSTDHQKGNLPLGVFAALLLLMEYLDNTAQGRRAVLKEIVQIRDAKSCLRLSGCHAHAAAGLEKDDHVALDSLEQQV